MLDYCKKILDLEPHEEKFKAFKWDVRIVDGHDVNQLYNSLKTLKEEKNNKPKLLIANTIKGKGVPSLETDPLCHIKSLKPAEIDKILVGLD
jgi:transketolase